MLAICLDGALAVQSISSHQPAPQRAQAFGLHEQEIVQVNAHLASTVDVLGLLQNTRVEFLERSQQVVLQEEAEIAELRQHDVNALE